MNLFRSFCCALVLAAIPGWGNALLTFEVGSGGSISYAGGANPLIGASIPISELIAAGAPQNDGFYSVANAVLSFQTGAFSSYDSNQQLLQFGPGGSITITGTVNGITTGSPLLQGSFLDASFDLNVGRFSLFLGDGPDVKDPQLVSHFFGGATPSWTFSADVYGGNNAGTQFHSGGSFSTAAANHVLIGNTTYYSQVVNTDAVASAPEPASMLLMGVALVGISLGLKRQNARRAGRN